MDEDSIVSDADYQTLDLSSEGLHYLLIIWLSVNSLSLFLFFVVFFKFLLENFKWEFFLVKELRDSMQPLVHQKPFGCCTAIPSMFYTETLVCIHSILLFSLHFLRC